MSLLTDVHPQELGQYLPGAHFPARSESRGQTQMRGLGAGREP